MVTASEVFTTSSIIIFGIYVSYIHNFSLVVIGKDHSYIFSFFVFSPFCFTANALFVFVFFYSRPLFIFLYFKTIGYSFRKSIIVHEFIYIHILKSCYPYLTQLLPARGLSCIYNPCKVSN